MGDTIKENDNNTIIVIGHSADLSGAPLSLLELLENYAVSEQPELLIILNQGGLLLPRYEALGKVFVFYRPPTNIFSRLEHRLFRRMKHEEKSRRRRLHKFLARRSSDVRYILNNTVITGHLLEMTCQLLQKDQKEIKVISRIPELEWSIKWNNQDGSSDKVFQFSDYMLAVSDAVKYNLIDKHGVNPSKIRTFYINHLRHATLEPQGFLHKLVGVEKDAVLIGACGTTDWRKGTDLFLQVAYFALTQLRQENLNAYFVWLGREDTYSLQQINYELEKLDISDNVFFVGQVSNKRIHDYYADLSLLLLTSREDPFPRVVVEAARQRTPTICFDRSGGAKEFVKNDAGVVVPYLDTHAMTSAVCELIRDRHKLQVMSEKARHRSMDYFNNNQMTLMSAFAQLENKMAPQPEPTSVEDQAVSSGK